MVSEADLIARRYARRDLGTDGRRYSMLSPDNWQKMHERQRAVLRLFARLGFRDLSQLNLLEVGAGAGGGLLEFLRIGFSPERLAGIELLPDRAALARRALPLAVQIFNDDAATANIPAHTQDIVYQSVVFSSLLDDKYQADLANSMWRWVKPGGGVLWYDFVFNNPSNPDVRGVPLRRVRTLFPEATVRHQRVTLAPPIARRRAIMHPGLYPVANVFPFLRTHLLCWIQKPS